MHMKSPSASSTAIPKGFCKENCTMYEYRDPYIIDFTGVKYYLQIHEIIKEALDFPDYYGKNWDAFWDCITDMAGETVHIERRGFDILEDKFPDTAQKFIKILRRFKHYADDAFIYDIRISIIDGNTERFL